MLEQTFEVSQTSKVSHPRRKSYPAYKPSGVAWLGDIPAHWEVRRLKFVSRINPPKTELASLSKDTEASFLPMEKIGEDGKLSLDETRAIHQVWQGFTYFRDDDVIVAKITPCFENGKGALCRRLVNGIGFGTTELHVLRAGTETNSRFLSYQTQSVDFRRFGVAAMYGAAGQQRVPENFVRDFRIGLPPFPEQRAIAACLDRETARLDALIAKKERLIELLQEKRTALISHAVTRGVPEEKTFEVLETSKVSSVSLSSALLKDSGVEWLGQVPTNWEVYQLRRVVTKFVDYRGATPDKSSDGIPLITARNIKNGRVDFDLSREFIREEDYAGWMVRGFPEVGDVLVTTEAPLGETAQVVETNIALAQRVILLKAEQNTVTNDFLKQYLGSLSGQAELWSRATGSTAIGIKASHLREILVIVPPHDEQRAIAAYLDRETATIDALIAKVRQAIETLREYRTALISAAVTGKMDVTG
ncbi:MAG: restriction endonuclease subunit S [Chloroflexi bacterium]|nr:restriction endonuclease subunit S [Chloroflexota bacterium]